MAQSIAYIGPGEMMAVGSSLLFSLTLVALRYGMRSGTPIAAVLVINVIVGVGGLTASLFRGTLQTSGLAPIFWFAVGGAIAQGVGTVTHVIGIERLGVSRSTLIHSSTPLWGVLFAIVALGERPTALVLLGTVCIVGGVSLLTFPEEDEARDFGSWFRGALIFPLVSSLAYAFLPIFSKFAFAHQKTPMAGVAVAYAAGTVVLLAGRRLISGGGEVRATRQGLLWFTLAAGFNVLAAALFWTALMVGDVSTVLPLSRLYPLFVVFLSYFFLGKMERITGRIVLSAVLVMTGGVLIVA
jgi:drug/metabolite transporter (DMT)-like permease